jgi:hypothetical protein
MATVALADSVGAAERLAALLPCPLLAKGGSPQAPEVPVVEAEPEVVQVLAGQSFSKAAAYLSLNPS